MQVSRPGLVLQVPGNAKTLTVSSWILFIYNLSILKALRRLMPNWKEESNVFSIDAEPEEEHEREHSSLLTTPKLSHRSIQQQPAPTSPRNSHTSRHPLLSPKNSQLPSPSTTIEMQSTDDKLRYATSSGQAPPKQSFMDRLLCRPVPSTARTFNIGTGEDLKQFFPPNIIRNQKYHPSTFIFVVLYNQVSDKLKDVHKFSIFSSNTFLTCTF